MSESVEQAELPAPWPDVLDSLQSIAGVNESLFGLIDLIRSNHADELESLHAENAELRDGMLALSNRIESCFGALESLHRDTSAALLGIGEQLGVDV